MKFYQEKSSEDSTKIDIFIYLYTLFNADKDDIQTLLNFSQFSKHVSNFKILKFLFSHKYLLSLTSNFHLI